MRLRGKRIDLDIESTKNNTFCKQLNDLHLLLCFCALSCAFSCAFSCAPS